MVDKTLKSRWSSGGGGTRCRRAGTARIRAGFTLVEALWVLVVMGILLTIAMPRIDVARFQVDAGVQEIASHITAYRGQAIVRQHDFVMAFDVAQDRVNVLFDANNNGTADEGEERRVIQLSDYVSFGRGGASALSGMATAVSFTKKFGTLPALTFRRNGAASEEGGVYITSLRSDGNTAFVEDTRALRVERSTGRVQCFSYRTQEWVEGC
jgi:prepilin-type N-terminal cleavage/methylation domain-containing protein